MIEIRRAANPRLDRGDGVKRAQAISGLGERAERSGCIGVLSFVDDLSVPPAAEFARRSDVAVELLTYVLEGELERGDRRRGGSVVRQGDLWRTAAGPDAGPVAVCAGRDEVARFLQVGILPDSRGVSAGHEQTAFPAGERLGRPRLVASPDGRLGSVTVHQDADVYLAAIHAGSDVRHALRAGRCAWLHVVRGSVRADGEFLLDGDGASFVGEPSVSLFGRAPLSEVVLVDMRDEK